MTSSLRLLLCVSLLTTIGCADTTTTPERRDAGRDGAVEALDVAIADASSGVIDAPRSTGEDAPGIASDAPGADAPGADATRADAPGARVDAQGMVSLSCGGRGGAMCGRGQFCNIPPENICGAADGPGVCTDIPELCTRELNPQCGCDGNTYGNPCMAAMAGVSIVSSGACRMVAAGSCDARRVACAAPRPRCLIGQAPSVVGSCWGPCVDASTCTCSTTEECPAITGFSEVCYRSGFCGPAL